MYQDREERSGGQAAPVNDERAQRMSRFQVKKVAVLGAGVMGAQIAAHLVNVKVPVVLFDLPAKDGPKNGIVTRAVRGRAGASTPPRHAVTSNANAAAEAITASSWRPP